MTASPGGRDASKATSARRILDASRTLLARGGASEISMGDVAGAADVSKALVHYHFHDKDTLLQALVEDVGATVTRRARASLALESEGHALDDYWIWLEEELRSGEIRILVGLGEYDSERVRGAARRVAVERLEIATQQIEHVFSRLGLKLRVPAALVAHTVNAFVDGLCAVHALDPDADPRPAFDVLWLALLALGE